MPNHVLDDGLFDEKQKKRKVIVPKQKKEWWHKYVGAGEEVVFLYQEKDYSLIETSGTLSLFFIAGFGAFIFSQVVKQINPEYVDFAGIFFFVELLLIAMFLESKSMTNYVNQLRPKFGITKTKIILTTSKILFSDKKSVPIPIHRIKKVRYKKYRYEETCEIILIWSGAPIAYKINSEAKAKELVQKIEVLLN